MKTLFDIWYKNNKGKGTKKQFAKAAWNAAIDAATNRVSEEFYELGYTEPWITPDEIADLKAE